MNPFHSWQVCQILLKKKLQNLAFKLPPSHGSIVTFSTRPMHKIQFRAVLWRILFAVVKLCRQLCGNRGNPNNRIWGNQIGQNKEFKLRELEALGFGALGSDRRYTLHGPKCASTPLSIHPSIHLLADISTYSRRKDLNTGELILTFRAWSGADHHQHIRGEPF